MESSPVTCECGCGAEVIPPRRFIHGHNGRLRAYPIYDGPPKLCECGCGGEVSLANRTSPTLGHIKGQPVRFIVGHRKGPSLRERFEARVPVGDPDECWEWTGGRLPGGYGALWDKSIQNNRGAHRLAWEFATGETIPKGMFVCHRCDNPPCCNPAHLFLGTQADNDRDRVEKNRTASPGAKLTAADAREIRYALSLGAPPIDLARSYAVTNTTICDIGSRKTWKRI